MEDIFEGEVENAQEEIKQEDLQSAVQDLSPELQEQFGNIQSLVKMNPDVVNSDEYKDLVAKIDEQNSGQASEEDEYEEDEYEDEEYEDEEYEDEDEEYEDEDEDEDADEDIEDVFGVTNSKSKRAKKVKIDFDVPEEMEELLNSKYGIEDASTFFTSVDTWRKQAQEGGEFQSQLEALTSDIQAMPPDLRTAITMWADGDDHTAVFTQGLRLDFASDFEDQDVESLVEHYLPEEYNLLVRAFNNEELEEDEFDDKIDLLARSTKRMFKGQQEALVTERADYEKQQANLQKEVKSSAISSVEALSKSFPNFSKSELSKVRNYLVDGKIDSLIYNSDGTYREEAAEMVANMMYGGKMRETIEKLAKRRGESEANQKLVDSSAKSVKKRKSSGTNRGSAPRAVQHLGSVITNDDPYSNSMD
jgi:hypothetical protein